MANGTVILFPGGWATDGTTNNNTAAFTYLISTGTPPSNGPNVFEPALAFDAATDEHWEFAFLMPGDYASGGTFRGVFRMASATSGNVKWKGGQVSTQDGSTADAAKAFAAADVAANAAAPGTLGQTASFTIALTMTTAAANRLFVGFIGRDADDATNDTAAGDAYLLALNFEYVTA